MSHSEAKQQHTHNVENDLQICTALRASYPLQERGFRIYTPILTMTHTIFAHLWSVHLYLFLCWQNEQRMGYIHSSTGAQAAVKHDTE